MLAVYRYGVRCRQGPLSVLFAYDAVAYYMWRVANISSSSHTVTERDDKISNGSFFGGSAKNLICEHGTLRTRYISCIAR